MASQREAEEEEAPIHGDVLEAIFSHVPLIQLMPACHVSKPWNRTVFSSLTHVKRIKPWLIILTRSSRASHVITAHAYDPRSNVWVEIKYQPLINNTSAVRSSHSSLLYTLSPNEFTFSLDALHLAWHHAPSPRVWRTDPIVARVGSRVVVAGGACDFEDDPLAVEMYDMESRTWITCMSMPAMLKNSSAPTWLSVAVVGDSIYVTEKNSGVTYSFNTVTKNWDGPYDLRQNQSVFYCVTGTLTDERLMVAGLIGDVENVTGVKLWEAKGEELGSETVVEVGEMPKEMVEKLKGDFEFGSVEVTWVRNFVYFRNPLVLEEIVVCEFVNGGLCEWRSLMNVADNGGGLRTVVCGGDVGMEDLQTAVVSKNWRFCMK